MKNEVRKTLRLDSSGLQGGLDTLTGRQPTETCIGLPSRAKLLLSSGINAESSSNNKTSVGVWG